MREEKEEGGTRREREQERKIQKSNRVYVLTKSESMTSTTLHSRDTTSRCVYPVLPTLLGTVLYVHVHVLTTTKWLPVHVHSPLQRLVVVKISVHVHE